MNEREAERVEKPASEELAHFLRTRRQRLKPEDVGITTTRSRRTPGLRREEVAFLADIGVKWYARLEMGAVVHPSPKTLLGISRALHLSRVDTEYLFELAAVSVPKEPFEYHVDIPETMTRLVVTTHGAMAAVTDLFLTPLRWNAIADATWGCSSFPTPLERNVLVRAFSDDGFIKQYTGADYEQVTRDAVGLFRRYSMVGDPNPFVRQIYERIRSSPKFREMWDAHVVTDQLNDGSPIVRHHPVLGALSMLPIDLHLPHRTDLLLKLWFPEDDETQRKFDRLETMGKPWNAENDQG